MLRLYGDEDGLDGDGYPDIGDRNPYAGRFGTMWAHDHLTTALESDSPRPRYAPARRTSWSCGPSVHA
jgi:hypothetical protein